MDTISNLNSIWKSVLERRDIFEVNDFIKRYHSFTLIDKAYILFQELKEEELKLIRLNHSSRCLALIRSNIFSIDELIECRALTKQSYEKILSKDGFLRHHYLKDPDDFYNIINYNEDVMVTDVFLFGGGYNETQMSILQGILASTLFRIDIKGTFEEQLYSYSQECYLFQKIPSWFTPIISGKIKNNRCINLILPSFDFTTNCILNKKIDDTVEAQILKNKHKKIFFFIIDPTTELCVFNREVEIRDEDGNIDTEIQSIRVRQSSRLKGMMDLLELDSNKEIMDNVDALHFIICNAEKLSQTGYDILKDKYGFLIDCIHNVCKGYEINKLNKYIPKMYSFSLGSFCTSDVFDYNSTDSDNILDVIYDNCARQKEYRGVNKVFRKLVDYFK